MHRNPGRRQKQLARGPEVEVDPFLIMSDVEDYPGPTKDHPEKEGHEETPGADESMVTPPARPEEEHGNGSSERPGGHHGS
jgi:hypothetical protein